MKNLYCTRDSVSGVWQDPQACISDLDAKRAFCFALAFSNIPDPFLKDIDLYCIGSFDEVTGHVVASEPIFIMNGSHQDIYDWRINVKGCHMEACCNEISEKTD